MKKNIQLMYPEVNELIQDEELSKTIHSYTIPNKTLLQVVIDLDHFEMTRLLIMYSTNDMLNTALLYTINKNKFEFVKIMLKTNSHIFDSQEILLESALTGNLDIIQLIKEYGIKLLDDIAITKFNENIRKGLISIARTGEYLKVKQLTDEFKIEFTEKYNSNYTLADKLFEIFIIQISQDNLNAMMELQKHLYEIFINHINRNEFGEEKCEKHTFSLKISTEYGAINLLQFLLPYYKDIGQKEKQRMLHDCLVSQMVQCANDSNFIKILEILDHHPDISIKSINFNKQSVKSVLSLNFCMSLYRNDLVLLKKILYFFPELYQEFLNKNENGYTMIVAISHSSNEVIEFLLKNNNVDLEVSDHKGNTLLLAAAKKLKHFPIVSLLLEKGANKEAVNHEGMSIGDLIVDLLIFAAKKERVSQITLIIETCKKHNINIEINKPSKEFKINLNDCFRKLFFKHLSYGYHYFLLEYEKCFPEMFKQYLISQDGKGNSPIMIAALNGNLRFVSKLLEKNVNQHVINFDGLTFKDCLIDGLYKKLNFDINFPSDIKTFEEKHPGIIDYYELLIKLLPIIDIEKLKFIFDNIKIDLLKSIPEINDTTLKILKKLYQLVQQLNSIPDCKAIKAMTKDIYLRFIAEVNNSEDFFNRLLNNLCNLSAQLQTTISYRGISRVYIKKENIIIKEKLDDIIKKFSNDIGIFHRKFMKRLV